MLSELQHQVQALTLIPSMFPSSRPTSSLREFQSINLPFRCFFSPDRCHPNLGYLGAAYIGDRISPALVGGDIGCGMAVFATTMHLDKATPALWPEPLRKCMEVQKGAEIGREKNIDKAEMGDKRLEIVNLL